ncbi:hypothetical protein KSP39_PZI002607 [Platanthera zijinensis]|uniref:Uncharacterized protein n=1 Tax=Platanthera zijinensis TaxID=2320716 RepID=A0AAP0GEN6_9ASPA
MRVFLKTLYQGNWILRINNPMCLMVGPETGWGVRAAALIKPTWWTQRLTLVRLRDVRQKFFPLQAAAVKPMPQSMSESLILKDSIVKMINANPAAGWKAVMNPRFSNYTVTTARDLHCSSAGRRLTQPHGIDSSRFIDARTPPPQKKKEQPLHCVCVFLPPAGPLDDAFSLPNSATSGEAATPFCDPALFATLYCVESSVSAAQSVPSSTWQFSTCSAATAPALHPVRNRHSFTSTVLSPCAPFRLLPSIP